MADVRLELAREHQTESTEDEEVSDIGSFIMYGMELEASQ